MKRLSGADALMLDMQRSKAGRHTSKVAIIDVRCADAAGRIHFVPTLRWKRIGSPLA